MNDRAALIRERFRKRHPGSTAKPFVPPAPPPKPALVQPRIEMGQKPFGVYLPSQGAPAKPPVWVQTPDPEPPLLKVRLPQSALIPLAQRWFEEWREKQLNIGKERRLSSALSIQPTPVSLCGTQGNNVRNR